MITAHYVRRPAEIGAAAAEHTATLEEEAAAAKPPLVAAAGGRAAATMRAQEASRAQDEATLDRSAYLSIDIPHSKQGTPKARGSVETVDGDSTTATAASRARLDAVSNNKEEGAALNHRLRTRR